ncbi:hypothetical protein AX774_g7573 [Zancudomyces culisetae]|uniref:Uncharacterized protein n=1 Tax=Zancudomyces culisetae TaxID=1213189 RepID=A0A1R1PDJ7_ZANCU|nr:hypothetical protein AX774_g7573 [Zancudomyces culisetae]|eukprot:OMH79021.1 hypothetical protein AX774_g7573 [Zancudomyces culisetae]
MILRSIQSFSLPGVAMIISAPLRRANPCSANECPPTTETHFVPKYFENLLASCSICCTSSRVGASTIAYGPSCILVSSIFGSVEIYTSIGIRNDAVFPLPVSAIPMMSRFCSPTGIACR